MAQAMRPTGATDEILIVLDRIDPHSPTVRVIELSLSMVRIRFATATPHELDQVFRRDLASIVRSICDGAAHAPGTIEQPEFCLRLGGLVLEGYSLATSTSKSGVRRIHLRISHATGNALGIFRAPASSEAGLALFTARILARPEDRADSERLFDEMLSQLYLPLVNLNAYLRHMLDGSTPGQGESLSHSVVQLKTRAETLQFAFDRLIAEKMVDRYTAEPGNDVPLLDSTAA